ncbi:MAG: hypothetical protein AAFN05_01225 [Pseudomonadota bacterium]
MLSFDDVGIVLPKSPVAPLPFPLLKPLRRRPPESFSLRTPNDMTPPPTPLPSFAVAEAICGAPMLDSEATAAPGRPSEMSPGSLASGPCSSTVAVPASTMVRPSTAPPALPSSSRTGSPLIRIVPPMPGDTTMRRRPRWSTATLKVRL